MTLEKYLEGLKKDTIVSIGAKEGSSFMYIGPAGDKEMISKCLDACIKQNKNRSKIEIERLEKDLLAFMIMDKSYLKDMDPKDVSKEILEYSNDILYVRRMLNKHKKSLKLCPYGLNRKVKDYYGKILDSDELVILIEGIEIGKYWLKSEFDKDNK